MPARAAADGDEVGRKAADRGRPGAGKALAERGEDTARKALAERGEDTATVKG
ncbi:hypothetical protein ACFU6S_18410 [Streptomyces sp. NPDC057456]|uniref:hypothetical protein n=1 Tax=Streptomyces sp. NPDC057456 TaxID=3346139 RepID=UPI00369DEAD5